MKHAALEKPEQPSSFQMKPGRSHKRTGRFGLPRPPLAERYGHTGNMAMQRLNQGLTIHKNSASAEVLGTPAYTRGNHIYFAPGQYKPETAEGKKILDHEMGHAVQQSRGNVKPNVRPDTAKGGLPVNTDAVLEREAEALGAAHLNMAGVPGPRLSAPSGQRRTGIIQGYDFGQAPFEQGYLPLTKSSQWFDEAEEYEKRLGGYAYNHDKSKKAIDQGLGRLSAAIFAYYKPMNPKASLKLIKESFFKEDFRSAGQVGLDIDEAKFDQILGRGNTRERMTMFYNAAYYASENETGGDLNRGFKALLQDIVFQQTPEERARNIKVLGLDEAAINRQVDYYSRGSAEGKKGKVMELGFKAFGAFKKLTDPTHEEKSHVFDKDVFSLGNLSAQAGFSETTGIGISQAGRVKRPSNETSRLRKTPAEYARRGAPLSEDELKFAFPEDMRSEEDQFKGKSEAFIRRKFYWDMNLPWDEGEALFTYKPDDSWYNKMHDTLRTPVVAGVSGTTTRMLTAYNFLKPGPPPEDFRLAIMGWMLTSRDHSLYEILKGSHIAGVKPEREEERINNVTSMYMTVTPLESPELRDKVARDHMFPHEHIYSRMVKEEDTSKEHFKAPTPAFAAKAVDEKRIAKTVNLSTAPDATLPDALKVAIYNYTTGMHSLLNVVLETGLEDKTLKKLFTFDSAIKSDLKSKLIEILDYCKQGNDLEDNDEAPEMIPILKPRQAEINDLKDMAEPEKTRKYKELSKWAGELIDQVYPELMAHVNMTVEAVKALPSVRGKTVYRGDWMSKAMSDYQVGNTITAKSLMSFSRSIDTAEEFAKKYQEKSSVYAKPMMLELALKGRAGKDIAKFSQAPDEKEVLFMPGGRFIILEERDEDLNGKPVKYFVAREF